MRPPRTPPQFFEWPMSDGYVVRGRCWPSDEPDATPILYLHGIQSHGGWYEWSGSLLAGCGGPIYMPDRRGSGMNVEARGDISTAERWLQDLDDIVARIAPASTARRCAIVGVSWGGKLALAWAMSRPHQTADLLLITPGVFPQVGVGFSEKVRIGAGLLSGGRARHAIPLDDPALFTLNPTGQAFIAADERKLTTATARFLYHSARLDRMLVRARSGALDCATTLVLAEHDRIIRNDSTHRWLSRVAAQRPTVVTLAGAAHTLEFEADAGPFERALGAWIDAVRRRSASAGR